MREINFIKKNELRWKEIEKSLTTKGRISPDHLSELFINLTDDLAYSRTHYPDSEVTEYLNQLTSNIHQKIIRNKKQSFSRIKEFWRIELPLIIYKQRKPILTSFIIFSLAMLIGIYSTHKDVEFVRAILGDQYVDKTIENIESGNPFGIYESEGSTEMFIMITWNNIKVSFNVFAAGIIFSFLSGIMLIYNGIMLGCFQYFFYTKKLFMLSILTVWVHGTLEITSIVIAGGAGIALGNSIMFPGTYSRIASLQRTAKESVKIIIGLIPLFIIAGFLEGFVTRYSRISTIPAAIIILLSLAFVIFYFIYYPYTLNKKLHGKNNF